MRRLEIIEMREDLTERQTNAGSAVMAFVALRYARMPCLFSRLRASFGECVHKLLRLGVDNQ